MLGGKEIFFLELLFLVKPTVDSNPTIFLYVERDNKIASCNDLDTIIFLWEMDSWKYPLYRFF